MKKIVSIFIALIFGVISFAQDTPFDKSAFKEDKDGLKEALKNLKEGDKFYLQEPFADYKNAMPFYEKAYAFNPNNADLNYKLGMCNINTNFRTRALPYFEKAYRLNPLVAPEVKYYIGQGYHLLQKWDDAIKNYNEFASKNAGQPNSDPELLKSATKKIQECKSGKLLEKKPIRVFIDNMGKNINTEYPEYCMIMNADGSEMYFTSRRNTSTGGIIDNINGGYFEDIFYSKSSGDGWAPATNVGEPINTKGHDATVALSPDGSKMLVYIDDKGDGNIYESVRKGDAWSKPKKMDAIICSPYHESSAWYSNDGKRLYFISSRPLPGSKDKMEKDKDIYYVTWNAEKQKWDNLVRLPDNINTPYDEDGLFVHPDGKTIYFSSRGHNSIGGYDIFSTELRPDGTFSDPINIGVPVNTPDDDVFFVLSASGRYGYMTSFREDGMGEKDLYKITFLGDEKPPILNSEDILLAGLGQVIAEKPAEPIVSNRRGELAILKGTIYDDKTKKPLYAKIELTDNVKGEILAEFESDPVNGRFLVSLPAGKNYGIAVKADGYLFHSENFDIPKGADYQEYNKDVYMKKIEVGEVIVLKNIFYDLAKYSLRPESKTELDRLIKLLNDNPTIKIQISGHTDSRGSDEMNKELSKNRAKEVVTYLIKAGISEGRLKYEGYGEEQLIHSDAEIAKLKTEKEREAAHQENRRTEFKIISK
ncbi:MAG: OmpA family protein [Crocinitomicaceae bacterium]|nr:OmpA family protein [Crocinitomicaceae bacterium]